PATVTPLQGATVPLAKPLPAAVAPGRLAAVTGAPPAFAVAPLGGASQIPVGGGAPQSVGPAQADVLDVLTIDDGTVWLATAEGVFADSAAGLTPLGIG